MSATVVSLLPISIEAEKPMLTPGNFLIPPAEKGDFNILHIGHASHPVYLDSERGSIRVPVVSEEVAQSIVYDAIISRPYGLESGVAEPGLFWVPGHLSKEQIKKQHADKLESAQKKQRQWFLNLVGEADGWWNQYHNHKMISDLHRKAAKYLNLEREWNIEGTVESSTDCPACTKIIPIRAVVCPHCRVILKPEEYKKLQFAEAR